MIITISHAAAAPTVGIEDADDCTRLHVRAGGLDDAEAGAVLEGAGLGRPGTPGHVWLDIAELRARAATGDEGWPARFDAMVAYARGKGWVDETGELVAAHLERG